MAVSESKMNINELAEWCLEQGFILSSVWDKPSERWAMAVETIEPPRNEHGVVDSRLPHQTPARWVPQDMDDNGVKDMLKEWMNDVS